MKDICENIYKESRLSTGMEQIDAADALGVSVRSLQAYEKLINPTVPPVDIVRNMCILYNDRGLAYKHVKNSPIGDFLPDYEAKPLPVATLSMIDSVNELQSKIGEIVKLTKDGMIDSSEEQAWAKILSILKTALEAINSLLNAKGGGG